MGVLNYQIFIVFLVRNMFCIEVLCSESENHIESRIIGGGTPTIQDAPFIASLQRKMKKYSRHVCGAVIVTEIYLLTSGHCVYDRRKKNQVGDDSTKMHQAQDYIIMCGSIFLNEGQYIEILRFFLHQYFNSYTLENDFGAIALANTLIFSDKVSPAQFPHGSYENTSKDLDNILEVGEQCHAYGWGSTKPRISFDLRVAKIPVIKSDSCAEMVITKLGGKFNKSQQLCAMEDLGMRDTCQGDSGGPLVCRGVVWGLVSWGVGCARRHLPAVYARTDVAMIWLEEEVFKIKLEPRSAIPSNSHNCLLCYNLPRVTWIFILYIMLKS